MGAASPTHPFNRLTPHQGWKQTAKLMVGHNMEFRNFQLTDFRKCGSLFWAQYSYLGLDPSQLTDQYADYGH
jgi:hypothetical protein